MNRAEMILAGIESLDRGLVDHMKMTVGQGAVIGEVRDTLGAIAERLIRIEEEIGELRKRESGEDRDAEQVSGEDGLRGAVSGIAHHATPMDSGFDLNVNVKEDPRSVVQLSVPVRVKQARTFAETAAKREETLRQEAYERGYADGYEAGRAAAAEQQQAGQAGRHTQTHTPHTGQKTDSKTDKRQDNK